MKSKKSFFNKTIFWKNVTLYWPIWAVYAVILLLIQPVLLWLTQYDTRNRVNYTYSDRLSDFVSIFNMEPHIVLIAIGAVLIGMALFHYLYNSKSANMIHSLPVDRTQLFFTNVISGIAFLAVPQLISSILTAIVALSYGITQLEVIAMWFLLCLGTDVAAFSVVTFCAMFTGHIVAMPVYVFIMNYFVYWVYYLLEVVVTTFGYGIDSLGRNIQMVLNLFCPLNAFLYNVGVVHEYDKMEHCIGATVEGAGVVLAYLLVAAVLYAVAYVVYQKRHIEQAGEILTVSWVKPIFRFGVGLTGGFFGAMMVQQVFRSIGIPCGMAGFIFLMLVLGIHSYFIADMLVNKSFRVFKKKHWVGCGIFVVALLASFFGLYGVSCAMEDYVPKLADVRSASVSLGYEIEFEGEEAETVIKIHQEILENKELFEAYEANGNYYYEWVAITYLLENGDYIQRWYILPDEYKEAQSIFETISELEQDPENYLKYLFCENYEDITLFNGGWFEAQFKSEGEYSDYRYETINFTSEQAKEMYEAVLADIQNGTLMKYNIYSGWASEDADISYKYSEVYMYLEYKNPDEKSDGSLMFSEDSWNSSTQEVVEYESWYSAYLNIGPDCENIVNKLIEFGMIESVDDIWWGEIEE